LLADPFRRLAALSRELDVGSTVSGLHTDEWDVVERPDRVSQDEDDDLDFATAKWNVSETLRNSVPQIGLDLLIV